MTKAAKSVRKPQNWFFSPGVVAVVTIVSCVVLAFVALPTRESEGGASTNSLLEHCLEVLGIRQGGVQVLCDDEECFVKSRHNLQRGDIIMRVPPSAIIEQRFIMNSTIGAVVAKHNVTVRDIFSKKNNLGQGFVSMFLFSLWTAAEKRQGEISPFYGWLSSLLPKDKMGGAIFWEDEEADCLDAATKGEADSLQRGLKVMLEAAEELCQEEPEAFCNGSPFTFDELQWGLGVYLYYNFQDQAIIPGMNFARFDNSRPGVYPQWNEQDHVLDIHVADAIRKGEEVHSNFPRGPASMMVTRGIFDPASRGIDARIRIGDPSDKLIKRYCTDKFHELMFGVNGRPKEALISCVAAMLANKKHRASFRTHRTNDELMKVVWGNLTAILQQGMESFKDIDEEKCKNSKTNLSKAMGQYVEFTLKTLKSNFNHCIEQYSKYSSSTATSDAPDTAEESPETP